MPRQHSSRQHPSRQHLRVQLLALATVALSVGCGDGARTEGAAPPAPPDPIGATVFGERALLFLEYPHLVRGEPARFLAHVTVLATGEPVRSGSVTLEVGTSALGAVAPTRDGLFIPTGSFPETGTFRARLLVRSEQVEEELDLGTMSVHATHASAADAAAAGAGEDPPNAVPFLLEQQWKVSLLLARAETRTLRKRLALAARAAVPEGASAVASSPMGGRLVAPAAGALPRTGDRVEAGQVLGFVEPPLGASELGSLRALDLQLDLEALDVLRAVSESETRLRFAERERERIAMLRAEGLSTQQHLDRADQDLEVARVESAAVARRKETLDALLARRGAVPGGSFVVASRFPLTAPIAGTVVEVRSVLGASVAPNEPIVRILDSSRLWIEGRLLEFDLPSLGEARDAVAEFPSLPGRRFEMASSSEAPPYIGAEVDPTSRSLLVRYEMGNADGVVRTGMLASLEIATALVEAAVTIPREAVVMDQGLPIAFVMLEGELFQKRELELGVEDGGLVEVRRGIALGERVATRGAYVVKLASQSPASFGAGHAH